MNIFSPFQINKKEPNNPYFDNSNRVMRILYRMKSYTRISRNCLKKGIPITDLCRSQFPYLFSDASEPPIVTIELGNYCNLKCPYCTSSIPNRKKGFISDEVFNKIICDLMILKPNRIRLVGNGEPTLHPKFVEYVSKLGKTRKFLSIVTNGQWNDFNITEQIIRAPFDLVEISIEAGGKEKYEASRVNGKYETLLSNLEHLKKLKDTLKSKTLINIRLMIRPSQKYVFKDELIFWKKYSDSVIPQFIMKINNTTYAEDIFIPLQNEQDDFPKCSLPFKHMEIYYTGEVLMCYYTPFQIGHPGLVIGNVLDSSIKELWNCKVMKEYREAHRKRDKKKMAMCKGCPGT